MCGVLDKSALQGTSRENLNSFYHWWRNVKAVGFFLVKYGVRRWRIFETAVPGFC